MAIGFLAASLIAACALSSPAADAGGTVGYTMFNGGLDLLGRDYSVCGRAREGVFSFRVPDGSREWVELRVRAAVNGKELPPFLLENGKTDVVAEAPRYVLVYTNAAARAELSFLAEKAVLALTLRRPSPFAVKSVTLGFGLRTDSDYVFDPSVGHQPYHEFPTAEPRSIKPGLASPPPWVFSYRKEGRSGCWSAALEPEREKIDFHSFLHSPVPGEGIGWSVDYADLPAEAGDFAVPPLVLRFGDADFFAALARHVRDLQAEGKMKVPARNLPAWHGETLACSWRYQREVEGNRHGRWQATEENCETVVRMLEEKGIPFGTFIIDDFWGRQHGIWEEDLERWKSLRGFIDRQHAKGRHVLLWVCTDGEGLPAEERVSGKQWNLESPAFQARLRAAARRMLSSEPGCYDADGVKFDFTATAGNTRNFHGCGYILRRFEMLTEALLAVKPEALLDYQCTNPYFTHTLTMLRLNDYFGAPQHGLREMRLRARIAEICAPGALRDTDHVGFRRYSYRGAYDFFRHQHEFGVRSLYLMTKDLEDEELVSILRTPPAK